MVTDEEFAKYLLERLDELENYSEKLRHELNYERFKNEKLRELVHVMRSKKPVLCPNEVCVLCVNYDLCKQESSMVMGLGLEV